MATIIKHIVVEADAAEVWDSVRDIGRPHVRLGPGFVVDTRLEPDARIVTFANGMQIRELPVGLDEEARRFAYAAVGDLVTHHNASMQVFAEGERRTRLVWTADVLPDAAAEMVGRMMEEGAQVMKRTLGRHG